MQIENIETIGNKAIDSYKKISNELGIDFHSISSAEKRIINLSKDKESFINLSRGLAQKAQLRESITTQPKEFVTGVKGVLTIKNYLGGYYYLTTDEIKIEKNNILLIEAKHTQKGNLPSIDDIKDGLIKMILFTNFCNVRMNNKSYQTKPILKLTTGNGFDIKKLKPRELKTIELLNKEKQANNFEIIYL